MSYSTLDQRNFQNIRSLSYSQVWEILTNNFNNDDSKTIPAISSEQEVTDFDVIKRNLLEVLQRVNRKLDGWFVNLGESQSNDDRIRELMIDSYCRREFVYYMKSEDLSARLDLANLSLEICDEIRRRLIKMLPPRIPTLHNELFNYNIPFDLVNQDLIEKVCPWITKKFVYYFGEIQKDEQSLIEYVCAKLLDRITAQSLYCNLSIVLGNDEALEFVIQLWRLVIFECEVKRLGLYANYSKFDPTNNNLVY